MWYQLYLKQGCTGPLVILLVHTAAAGGGKKQKQEPNIISSFQSEETMTEIVFQPVGWLLFPQGDSDTNNQH